MKYFYFVALALFFALMLYATTGLPEKGDPAAPAMTHITPEYIENTIEDTHTPNIVTSVLADYRSYDTLGETVVIFTAGLACVIILMTKSH
ncbi:hydrogen gas-evolving membrane-bound hydrogenase subunit E [Chloroflexota bacterium]